MMTNKELDKWLAENVMGWKYAPTTETWIDKARAAYWWKDSNENYHLQCYENHWQPTESISHAFQVVEKMMEKFPDWFFTLDVFGDNYTGKDRAVAIFHESAEGYIEQSCVGAETRAKAICLACKAAIEGGE